MKKIKFSELPKLNRLGSDGRVISLSSDMKTLSAVLKTGVNDSVSSHSATGFTGSNIHEVCDRGISYMHIADGVPMGFPYSIGSLLNIQRLPKDDVTPSQLIFQIYFTDTIVYYRRGKGNGETVVYAAWKKFVFE